MRRALSFFAALCVTLQFSAFGPGCVLGESGGSMARLSALDTIIHRSICSAIPPNAGHADAQSPGDSRPRHTAPHCAACIICGAPAATIPDMPSARLPQTAIGTALLPAAALVPGCPATHASFLARAPPLALT